MSASASAASVFAAAAEHLFIQLKNAPRGNRKRTNFCVKQPWQDAGRQGGVEAEDGEEERGRVRKLIERDAEARLGAMAVHAMRRFGAGAGPVLDAWRRRYPDRPLLSVVAGGL